MASGEEQIVLTGAPNLFHLKGTGPLPKPLKIVYAREGAVLFDGHKPGREVMTLKRAKIRGVESTSMACSEKELGISDDHDGIIILDDDAPVGAAAADYMGDVVFEVKINPNMARNACVLGIAREIAALTGAPLRPPALSVTLTGAPIAGRVGIDIREPALNPRFVLGLIEGARVAPSPYWVQRRLRLVGTRPISNIVDATNYVMFELGEPLHAFDWDVLVRRAGSKRPTIITRRAEAGETLTTLDGVERTLDPFTVLVCDGQGPLSLAGVMGGAESEVADTTTNVLLEGAAWDFINVRKTVKAQGLPSEASYRFSRGVHPDLAEKGVVRALELMRQWTGGTVARGLVDRYPGRPDPVGGRHHAGGRRASAGRADPARRNRPHPAGAQVRVRSVGRSRRPACRHPRHGARPPARHRHRRRRPRRYRRRGGPRLRLRAHPRDAAGARCCRRPTRTASSISRNGCATCWRASACRKSSPTA